MFWNYSQVVAVAARNLKMAQEFAKKHNIPRAYGSYDELAKDPDIGEFMWDLGQNCPLLLLFEFL